MPQRLYREDSFLTRFSARVTAVEAAPQGRLDLELDRTAFYPTGGGQPHDTGRLAGLPVIDVREGPQGRILHTVAAAGERPPVKGEEVQAEIDWARRFDHMQQHSGQHILSRAFLEAAGAPTRSFHLGPESCTIDLDRPGAAEPVVREAERRANDVVFGDHPVAVRLLPADRAGEVSSDQALIRELALKPGDPIRIVEMGGFDATPCGGTHVTRTGQVGCIAVTSCERLKGGLRVGFVCGGRAVRRMADLSRVVDACGARLSSPPSELPAAIERLQGQMDESRRTIRALREAQAGLEASRLEGTGRTIAGCLVAAGQLAPRGMEEILLTARRITSAPGRIALLAAVDPATGTASLVFARSASGTPESLRMGDLIVAVCAARGGRGGGGPTLARGGGLPADQAEPALDDALDRIGAQSES